MRAQSEKISHRKFQERITIFMGYCTCLHRQISGQISIHFHFSLFHPPFCLSSLILFPNCFCFKRLGWMEGGGGGRGGLEGKKRSFRQTRKCCFEGFVFCCCVSRLPLSSLSIWEGVWFENVIQLLSLRSHCETRRPKNGSIHSKIIFT